MAVFAPGGTGVAYFLLLLLLYHRFFGMEPDLGSETVENYRSLNGLVRVFQSPFILIPKGPFQALLIDMSLDEFC